MDNMNVNAEVLEKIFNQEEMPVIALKEFEIYTYLEGHHLYKDIWTPELNWTELNHFIFMLAKITCIISRSYQKVYA